MRAISHACTDVGMQRSNNQDSFGRDEYLGLFLVADGMGGHAAGEVASELTARTICDYVRGQMNSDEATLPLNGAAWQEILRNGVLRANELVHQKSISNSAYAGMGTTVTGLLIRGNIAYVFHVGDSRFYSLRDSQLRLLSSDHSWVNEQIRQNIITPAEARKHPWRNMILRAVGTRPDLQVDTFEIELAVGDRLLLCSDGLSSMVEDESIRKVLDDRSLKPETITRKLVAMANEAGGTDNITVIVIQIED